MRRRHWTGGLVTLALTSATSEGIATACSWSTCTSPPAVAPSTSQLLPANAPAFVLHAPDYDVDDVVFRGPGGARIATKVVREATEALVLPGAPLAPDTEYVVEPTVRCTSPSAVDTTAKTSNVVVKTGPASDLPTAIGTIFVESPRVLDEGDFDGAVVKIDPTPALAAYLPITRTRVTVDGIALPDYGPEIEPYGRQPSAFAVECPSPNAAWGTGCDGLRVRAGTHVVEVSVHVAGATVDPPAVSTSFTLECRPRVEPARPPVDGKLSADATIPPESGSGCGCRTAIAEERTPFWTIGAFALVLALALTRRGARRTV